MSFGWVLIVGSLWRQPSASELKPMPPVAQTPPAPKASTCKADANHCCLADGTLVVPGGCQPDYPSNVRPATNRGQDGYCLPIECTLKCLPADAMIATPIGDRPVSQLRIGDAVWTATREGERVAAPIVQITSHAVRDRHSIIELTLADGRHVRASAAHPLADGSLIGDVRVGVTVDGSAVTSVRALPYDAGATWDLRPAGATGTYWSDGVRIGSTLR